jgi:hypothetical protein
MLRRYLQADTADTTAQAPVKTGEILVGYRRGNALGLQDRLCQLGGNEVRVVANGLHRSSPQHRKLAQRSPAD